MVRQHKEREDNIKNKNKIIEDAVPKSFGNKGQPQQMLKYIIEKLGKEHVQEFLNAKEIFKEKRKAEEEAAKAAAKKVVKGVEPPPEEPPSEEEGDEGDEGVPPPKVVKEKPQPPPKVVKEDTGKKGKNKKGNQ